MSVALEFDGERVVPGQTPVYLMWAHAARYEWAKDAVRKKSVLDTGCGAGYGTYYLAQYADRIQGVDVSSEDIDYAQQMYSAPNLSFAQMDCCDLSYNDNSFDVVVSFEMIEHLKDIDGYLKGVHRVLKPNGTFIVSTPNGGSNLNSGDNPFHEKEFEADEFDETLKAVFSEVTGYGQICTRPWREYLFMKSTALYLKSPLYQSFINSLAPLYFRGERADPGRDDPAWVERISAGTFRFTEDNVDQSTYLLAICKK